MSRFLEVVGDQTWEENAAPLMNNFSRFRFMNIKIDQIKERLLYRTLSAIAVSSTTEQ